MEILRNLFYGFPDLWGGGVAHSVMILALVITLGLSLGKLKVTDILLRHTYLLRQPDACLIFISTDEFLPLFFCFASLCNHSARIHKTIFKEYR